MLTQWFYTGNVGGPDMKLSRLRSKWRKQESRVVITKVEGELATQLFGEAGITTFEDFLERTVAQHRRWNPNEDRCDQELADEIMDIMWHMEIVGKGPDGKFLVPHLIGAKSFRDPSVFGALQTA